MILPRKTHSIVLGIVPIVGLFAFHSLIARPVLPEGWDPLLAGNSVLKGLITVTERQVKGAHDAALVCVGDRAYVVAEVNDVQPSESAKWPFMYVTLSVVNLKTLELEGVHVIARSGQKFKNATLPHGACFVPRIIKRDERTLRCFFASEDPGHRQSRTYYIDFDVVHGEFADTIHQAKLEIGIGVVPMEPRHFHADAVAAGFQRPPVDYGLYIIDSFKILEDRIYVAINNWPGGQNALAVLNEQLDTFTVIGHFNEPQTVKLTESAVHRMPDGTWLAICRQESGSRNYMFATSRDGRQWTKGEYRGIVPNGTNSKPLLERFAGIYYLGWQENSRVGDVARSVFNIDVSLDGVNWVRKYRFETEHSFQYPFLYEHRGDIWLAVTHGDYDVSRKERIVFGKLESALHCPLNRVIRKWRCNEASTEAISEAKQ